MNEFHSPEWRFASKIDQTTELPPPRDKNRSQKRRKEGRENSRWEILKITSYGVALSRGRNRVKQQRETIS